MVATAARDSVPTVWPMFLTFRIMVACGFAMLLVFGFSFWSSLQRHVCRQTVALRLAVISLPLPWLAIEAGWFVADTAASRGRCTACCPPAFLLLHCR